MEGFGNSGGEGGQRKKQNYRVCMGEIWKFRGVGGLFTNSLLGGVWIFSGTTQCVNTAQVWVWNLKKKLIGKKEEFCIQNRFVLL